MKVLDVFCFVDRSRGKRVNWWFAKKFINVRKKWVVSKEIVVRG